MKQSTARQRWLPARGRVGLLACLCLSSTITQAALSPGERVDRQTKSALALDADVVQGKELFAEHCSVCHGAGATGDAARVIPALAGQRFNYLVRQLVDFAGRERDSRTMHQALSESQVNTPQAWVDIAAFLNHLPPLQTPEKGHGEHRALGRGIFREQCASCHESAARGDRDGFVPALRHQHYSYLVRQMKDLAAGHRHNVDEDLIRFMRTLNATDINGLADYLSRLRGDEEAPANMRSNGVVVN